MPKPTLVRLEDRTNPVAAFALSNNSLIPFDTVYPTTPQAAVPVTGLGTGENLVGIDVRPQNGQLYGLTSNGSGVRLYAISQRTGVATPLTTDVQQHTSDAGGTKVAITGTSFGFDFNPSVDRVRVVTDSGLNFRINPNTGTLIDTDADASNGVNPDKSINGDAAKADGTAYTNNSPNFTVTTQYGLDSTTDKLFIQNPPNNGTATVGTVVTLGGTALDFSGVNGFDIPPGVNVLTANAAASGTAFAALTVGGKAGLYSIELSNAKATLVGLIGDGSGTIQGLAVQGAQAGTPLVAFDGTNLVRFSSSTPTTQTTVKLGTLTAGETLVGIDFRPATGQLVGLGVNDTADTGTVYIIDPQTGAATVVGTAGSVAFVDAAGAKIDLPAGGYGVDFNPTVDKLRVVANNGLNFRVNPITGTGVDADTNATGIQADGRLNVGGTAATGDATAYTNSFGGTTVTTQYTLDSATDKLFIQNPPNNGVLTAGVAVTLGGKALDFSAVNGFDIPASVRVTTSNAAATGSAFAALTVGGVTGLYSIDLTTGAATSFGNIGTGGAPVSGLAAADTAAPLPAVGVVGGPEYIVGADAGGSAIVAAYGPGNPVLYTVDTFPGFTGGVRVASGDVNGDGVQDVIVGTGPGRATQVRVLSGVDRSELFSVAPFEATFTGGVYVAVGDITGDGKADLIITPDQGGGPRVDIYSGAGFGKVNSFFGIDDTNFRGGARAATGDVNGDGRTDLIVAAGFGGGPRVAVFNGTTVAGTPARLFNDFFAFEQTLRNGVFITAGDLTGDGKSELVAGGGPGGGPRVTAFDANDLLSSGGGTLTQVANFFAGDTNSRGGIRVAVKNLDGDARADLVVGAGTGAGNRVTGYLGKNIGASGTPATVFDYTPLGAFTGGVFVG